MHSKQDATFIDLLYFVRKGHVCTAFNILNRALDPVGYLDRRCCILPPPQY